VEHPQGTFCFAELHTPDVEAAMRFYGGVFGWEADTVADGYVMCRLQRQDVIAMRQTSGSQRLLGYVRVADVDRAATRAQELGGRVVTAPFDTNGFARTCVIEDPEGAAFGLWEARGHGGADMQDRTGTMWWCELMARDIRASREFYAALFGWTWTETQKWGIDSTVFQLNGVSVATALQYDPEWGVTAHWGVFFAIEDWDATLRQIASSGGELEFWRDVPHAGRLGRILDPACALFIIMRPQTVATTVD
jgi:hypothetical protein